MNYPKEFYVTKPIVGDKVWLDSVIFNNGKKAFHGPWWIVAIHSIGNEGSCVRVRREDGPPAIVLVSQLLRMSKGEIRKMAVIPSKPV